jgi:hypothetical protein
MVHTCVAFSERLIAGVSMAVLGELKPTRRFLVVDLLVSP